MSEPSNWTQACAALAERRRLASSERPSCPSETRTAAGLVGAVFGVAPACEIPTNRTGDLSAAPGPKVAESI
jgi:hypothetical protein